ncbi:hypothetical protein M5005_Spy0346 [Streptococcus pyogenes MGAS5005]|nr:Hypothetical protein M6_Spy0371 [Streptococcus pyogenes MGAS10394]AAZ50964.1 hypothetical protein M5005_Spy0346 [Streptococcus pyogenes MGAS5005]EQL78156.1 hypothetical protein HMPREF1230_0410 [Streptococcus pyogenes GA19681]ERL13594.1 hypothetical protein HMPREF1231_0834 [Streptococcus pyogenes GA06023]ESA47847.1 hypothetical protein HMPREF1233_0690 [Streptococcus pyogenes GA19700]ESA56938.1 hypothetical protein HMPREF1239_0474 [Streptococcus pyogenes GA03805]ESU88663.1 hypothetical prote
MLKSKRDIPSNHCCLAGLFVLLKKTIPVCLASSDDLGLALLDFCLKNTSSLEGDK